MTKNVPVFKTEKCAAEFVCPNPTKGVQLLPLVFQKVDYFPEIHFSILWHIWFFFLSRFFLVASFFYSYPEIGNTSFKCALWTFKQQLALKMRARCRISIVLLQMSLYCGFRNTFINLLEFFLNVFHWIRWIQWQKIYDIKRTRTCHPVTSCVRDQDATTLPARHMWEIGSLNWAQFMLQWFISFSEFTEFSESSAPFRKNSISSFSFRFRRFVSVEISPSGKV